MAGPVAATPGSPMRLGGGATKNAKALAVKVLAWVSFALGIAAAPLLAGTFVGGIVDNLLGFFPAWVALTALVGLVVMTAVDLFSDGVPNRVALYCAMGSVSVARSVDGRLGDNVELWANTVLTQVRGPLGEWLGTSSALALAMAAGLAAWLVSRRTMAAKAAGGR